MVVVAIIIAVIVLFIFLTGKSGVGIKSSLVNEIRSMCRSNSPPIYHPSISLEEAYNALQEFDSKQNFNPEVSHYAFWAIVNNIPCKITLSRVPYKKGFQLMVVREENYKSITSHLPEFFRKHTENEKPNHLRHI